jgi:hypothetical protein
MENISPKRLNSAFRAAAAMRAALSRAVLVNGFETEQGWRSRLIMLLF